MPASITPNQMDFFRPVRHAPGTPEPHHIDGRQVPVRIALVGFSRRRCAGIGFKVPVKPSWFTGQEADAVPVQHHHFRLTQRRRAVPLGLQLMNKDLDGNNAQHRALAIQNGVRKIQATHIGHQPQCKIDGGIPGCQSLRKVGAKSVVATHEAVFLLIVIGGNGQAVHIHQIDIRAAHDRGHPLHFFVGLQNDPRVIRSSQGFLEQGMLSHKLRDGEIPVQLVGDKLTVTKRFLKAFLFHLPVAGPASQCPGHQ